MSLVPHTPRGYVNMCYQLGEEWDGHTALEISSSKSQYSANSAQVPPGWAMHQTMVQRFLHQTSAVHILCDAWTYLSVIDGPGFIFVEPTGFFPIFFPLDPAAAAEGCVGCMLISFARGVSGGGGVATAWSPWLEGLALDEGDGGMKLALGPVRGDLSAFSVP